MLKEYKTSKKNSMQEFQVEITETLTRVQTLKANDELAALKLAKQMYADEAIVLTADDYLETEFTLNQL